MVTLKRISRHLLSPRWLTRRRFPPSVAQAIEAAVRRAEARHHGEIRFVVESALLPEEQPTMLSVPTSKSASKKCRVNIRVLG